MEYTKEQLDKFRHQESFIRLNQLKVGDTIDERLEKDLRLITGPRLEATTILKVDFKNGEAHTLDTDIISEVNVGGRNILKRPDENNKQ